MFNSQRFHRISSVVACGGLRRIARTVTKLSASSTSENTRYSPTHLFRLRYFGDENRWGFAFFACSSQKYELSMLPTGDFYGTPEDAFDAAAMCYLS
jgi:hypothetical protein